jgi:hypothetical protein
VARDLGSPRGRCECKGGQRSEREGSTRAQSTPRRCYGS